MQALSRLRTPELRRLAEAFRSKRLRMPATVTGLSYLAFSEPAQLVDDLMSLHRQAFAETQVASLLDAMILARTDTRSTAHGLDLVASGPDVPGVTNRDTSVVVQELFRLAQQRVLLVGYSVYQGNRLFAALAEEMRRKPDLEVILCLNIGREGQDTRTEYEIRHRFLTRFKQRQWPVGYSLPKLFYYPLAIDPDPSMRASLHAKCIVVDEQYAFVSSANFTERGQKRNIELGVRVEGRHLAGAISAYILKMIEAKQLMPLT